MSDKTRLCLVGRDGGGGGQPVSRVQTIEKWATAGSAEVSPLPTITHFCYSSKPTIPYHVLKY